MKYAAIFAAGDDRGVSKTRRLSFDEFMDKFSFNFPLANALSDKAKHAPEASFGDVTGFLYHLNLQGVFDDSELMHQGREAFMVMMREVLLAFFK